MEMMGNKCGKTQLVFKCSFFFKNVRVCIFPINFPEKYNIVNRAWQCGRYLYGWQMYTAHKKNKGIFQNNSNESMLCMKRILKYICVLRLCIFFRAYVVGLKCFVGTVVFQVAIHFRFIWFDFGKVAL